MLGVHVDAFISLASSRGLGLRWSTRKEAGHFMRAGMHPIKRGKKILLADIKDGLICLQDGLFFRVLFHGLTPASLLAFFAEDPSAVSGTHRSRAMLAQHQREE